MTIEEKVLAVWAANSGAIALVPAARFKVPGNWQELARPYIIQQPVAESPNYVHNGGGSIMALRTWEFYQISIVADSYSSAKAVAEKCRTVFTGNISGVQFFYRGQRWLSEEQDEGTGMMAVDLRISETLSN